MKLIPIKQTLEANKAFLENPDCKDIVRMSVEYYKQIGFAPPWVGYLAQKDGQVVGTAAFKGGPANQQVEIAYATFEPFRQQGIGTEMCRQLVELATKTDPSISITARTLPEKNHSTRILERNNFEWLGSIMDDEDGEVWEWRCKKA